MKLTKEKKEEIKNIISDIMINDGPDGHCDGAGVIAYYVECLLTNKDEAWKRLYFGKYNKEKYFYEDTE